MPASFLRKAAVAALASTSGRKLPDYNNKPDYGGDALTVYNCPDDICGDQLVPDLALTEDSGTPVLTSEGVALTNETLAHQIYMADNNIPGLFNNDKESKIYVDGKNIEVQVHLRDSEGYNHDEHACELSVVMRSISGTSATFRRVHGLPDSFVIKDRDGEYLKATIPTPAQAKNSLGTIKAGIGLKLKCKDPSNGLDDVGISLITGAELSDHNLGFQAEYTYTRDADKDGRWAWEVLPDDGGGVSGLSEAKITTAHSHKSRQVSVKGKSVVVGRKGAAIRFPEGQWDTYNRGDQSGNINYEGQLQCKVRAEKEGSGDGQFFDGHAEFLQNWYDENVQASSSWYSYGNGTDANCIDGVCDGRMHRVENDAGESGFSFTTALGFEAPYTEYFEAAPAIICENGLSNAPQKVIEGIAASKGNGDSEDHYRIGLNKFKVGYDTFSTSSDPSDAVKKAKKLTIAGGDYGDAFFKGSDTSFMGETQIFQHTEAQAYWRHVSDQFDFNVKIVNNETDVETIRNEDLNNDGKIGDDDKGDYLVKDGIGYYYTGAQNEAGVRSNLGDIIQALDNATVPRPTLYGQTRGKYKVCVSTPQGSCKVGIDAIEAESDVMFRRDSSNIRIELKMSGTETVKHDEDVPMLQADVLFDGTNLPWVMRDATHTSSYALPASDVKAAIEYADGTTRSSTFLKIFDTDTQKEGALFVPDTVSKSSALCTSAENPPIGGTPWCTIVSDVEKKLNEDLNDDDMIGDISSDPFLCKASSVDAERVVTKDSKDDRRVASEQTVRKSYSRSAAAPAPRNGWFTNGKPIVAEKAKFTIGNAVLHGSKLPDTVYSLEGFGSLGDNMKLLFGASDEEMAFNCHKKAESQHTEFFTAKYNEPCKNEEQTHTLSVDVDVTYDSTVSPDNYRVQTVSNVRVDGDISMKEWDLQREDTKLTFKVASKGGIPAKHFDGDFTFGSRYMGEGDFSPISCSKNTDESYSCEVTVKADPFYDELQLEHGERCCRLHDPDSDYSCEEKNGIMLPECPYVEIEAKTKTWQACNGFSDDTKLLFLSSELRPNSDLNADDVISSDQVALEKHRVYLQLEGSNEIYDGNVEVQNLDWQDKPQKIASIHSPKQLVPGSHKEYESTLGIDLVGDQFRLKGMQYAIVFDKHTLKDTTYVLSSPEKELLLCQKQTFSDNKCEDAVTSLKNNPVTLTLDKATSTTVYVRFKDETEPCKGKFKGEDAYDNGFKIKIERDNQFAHTFTVPVKCGHTEVERLETDGQQEGSAWYRKNYAVKIVGSALDKNNSPMTATIKSDADRVVKETVAFDDAVLERDDAGNILNRLNEVIFSQKCTEASTDAKIEVQVNGYDPTLEIDLDCPAEPLQLKRDGQLLFSSDAPNGPVHNLKPDSIDKKEGTVTINRLRVSNRISVAGAVPECSLSGRSNGNDVSVLSDTFDTNSEESSFEIDDTCDTMVTVSVTCRISTQDTSDGDKTVKFRVPCPKAELELHAIQGGDSQKVAQGDDPTLLREQEHTGDIVTFYEMHLDNRDPNLGNKAVTITTEAFKDGKEINDDPEVVLFSGDEIGDVKTASVGLKFTKGGADCDFVTLTFTSRRYEYLKPDNSTDAVMESVKFYMACPNARLRLYKDNKEIHSGALVAGDTHSNDVFYLANMVLGSRDPRLSAIPKIVTIASEANSGNDKVEFAGADITDNFSGGDTILKFIPGSGSALTCNFMKVEFTTQRTDLADPETVMFRVQCPRIQSIHANQDKLELDYTITNLTFGLSGASIQLPKTPVGVETHRVGFAAPEACDSASDLPNMTSTCDLAAAVSPLGPKTYSSASNMMTVISDCGGKTEWQDENDAGEEIITSKGYATRVYRREHPFYDNQYDYHCGASTVKLEVVRSAKRTMTVAVESAPVIDFAVHVTRAEFMACEGGKQRLEAHIDVAYQNNLPTDTASTWQTTGLQIQEENSFNDDGTFTKVGDEGHEQLQFVSECLSKPQLDNLQDVDIAFTLRRDHLGLVHTGHARVGIQVTLEEEEEGNIGKMSQEDLVVNRTCANGDDVYQECAVNIAEQIKATDDVKLVLSIREGSEEEAAFDHTYSSPVYCAKETCEEQDWKVVKDLTSEYVARSGTELVSSNNAQVALRALPFAGNSHVNIRWTVSRVEIPTRLRRLLTVTYALGADGSVSKSASFSVAPAVRESSGASAVGDETVELITEKSVPNGTERTTEVLEEKKDNGLMIGMIISSSVLGVGVIALAVIVAVRKNKEELPGAGGNSDRAELLWKTNRFTGEAF